MARGDHEGGRFRAGGDRARLGGHGFGRRVQGSSTAGRVGGDFNMGMAPFGLTDAAFRVGGRRHRHPPGGGFGGGFGMGRRMRRGRRR